MCLTGIILDKEGYDYCRDNEEAQNLGLIKWYNNIMLSEKDIYQINKKYSKNIIWLF